MPFPSSGTIAVPVNGDATLESAEFFKLGLTNPGNATIADGLGIGTIDQRRDARKLLASDRDQLLIDPFGAHGWPIRSCVTRTHRSICSNALIPA